MAGKSKIQDVMPFLSSFTFYSFLYFPHLARVLLHGDHVHAFVGQRGRLRRETAPDGPGSRATATIGAGSGRGRRGRRLGRGRVGQHGGRRRGRHPGQRVALLLQEVPVLQQHVAAGVRAR